MSDRADEIRERLNEGKYKAALYDVRWLLDERERLQERIAALETGMFEVESLAPQDSGAFKVAHRLLAAPFTEAVVKALRRKR